MKIELKNISKSFGNVVALDDVSIEINSSEVLGLLGDNGAGKSTLIKILSGIHQKDSGTILIDGEEVTIDDPKKSQILGVATAVSYTHLTLPTICSV